MEVIVAGIRVAGTAVDRDRSGRSPRKGHQWVEVAGDIWSVPTDLIIRLPAEHGDDRHPLRVVTDPGGTGQSCGGCGGSLRALGGLRTVVPPRWGGAR